MSIVIKYWMLLPAHLLSGLVCWILSPVLPAFAIGRETLPSWLSWFQTPDAPLDGDSGFAVLFPPDKWPKYLRRVMWLIRNPAYGFAWTVLSFQPIGPEFNFRGSISLEQLRRDNWFGWYLITLPCGHFQFACRYHSVFGKQFRFRFGWRIVGMAKNPSNGDWKNPQKYVFTINPFDGG